MNKTKVMGSMHGVDKNSENTNLLSRLACRQKQEISAQILKSSYISLQKKTI